MEREDLKLDIKRDVEIRKLLMLNTPGAVLTPAG